jgi:hypothetical protein
MSAASSIRDSVPATLPHHLRSNCLHATAAPRLAPRKPHHPLQPRAQPPSAHSTHHQRIAGVCKHPRTAQLPPMARGVPPMFSVVSCAILPRLGASDTAPSALISLSARPRRPSARPSQAPPPATAPRQTASNYSTHHHQRIAGGRKHPRTAQLPPMARSVQLRSSVVNCAILPRLGASDAAPAAPIRLSARTTAPPLAPRKPHRPLQPRAQPPQPTTRSIISALPALASTREQPQLPPMSHSVPMRFSDVSCAILPRLGASDAAPSASIELSANTAAPRKPHRPLQPRAQPPQPIARSIGILARPAFASTREQHKPSRRTQRTAEIQRRQLRHPQETRCQRRCPSCSDPIVCTHRHPSARPSQALPPATAPRASAPAYSTQHHQRIAGVRKHPLTAHLPPMHAAYR